MTPYHESDGVTLYHGDNVQTMREAIPDASIDLVVTSPPYDNLRTYGGHTWDSDGLAAELWRTIWDFEALAAELWRTIKPGGVVVWIVNDATVDGSETGTSFRQALHFKDLGFRLHDTMIWEKATPAPQEQHPRYQPCFEFMFVLCKGYPPTVFNGLREPASTAGRATVSKCQRHADGSFRHPDGKRMVTGETRLRRNIWQLRSDQSKTHPAAFPESLARDHILSWSNEGDTVLDPFSGSGTTLKMARLMGRNGIGIEIHQEYCDIAVERLRQRLLF